MPRSLVLQAVPKMLLLLSQAALMPDHIKCSCQWLYQLTWLCCLSLALMLPSSELRQLPGPASVLSIPHTAAERCWQMLCHRLVNPSVFGLGEQLH